MKPRPFLFLSIIILAMYLSQLTPNCISIPEEDLTEEEPSAQYNTQEQISLKQTIEDVKRIIVQTTGESMEPAISKNEKCLCLKQEEYFVNDIVMYLREDGLSIAHRIIEKEDGKYITKGDNNKFIDNSIEKSQIICQIEEVPLWKSLLM